LQGSIKASDLSVGVGSTQLSHQTIYPVSSFQTHERFEEGGYTGNYDVALVKLSSSIRLIPGSVEKINLPTFCPNLPIGKKGLVAGWGQLGEKLPGTNVLNEIKLEILDSTAPGCDYYTNNKRLSPTSFCAGSADASGDTCQGDSGGPLVCVNEENNDALELCGIVSWGTGCNKKGIAGVYMNVCEVLDWIDTNRKSGGDHFNPAAQQQPAQRPFYPSINQQRPSLEIQQRPSFGIPQRPSFGITQRPSFGVPQRPSFGVPQRPSFGIQQRPSFGIQRPSFASNQFGEFPDLSQDPFFSNFRQF